MSFLSKSWSWFRKGTLASVTSVVESAITTSKVTGQVVHLYPTDHPIHDYIYELNIACLTMTVRTAESTFVGAGWTVVLHYKVPSYNG
jgi:hypothetical protein